MKKLLLCFAVASLGMTANSYAQLTENFEGSSIPTLPTGWSDVHTGAGHGWETINTAYAATSSISIPAHTVYAVVKDASYFNNYPANLISPTFSLASSSGVWLTFDVWFPQYHLTAAPQRREIGWVDISNDGGSSWSLLDSVLPYNGWATRAMQITSTSATCKLRFCYSDHRIGSTDTVGIIGMGIDNIKVFTPPTSEIALVAVSPIAGDPFNAFGVTSAASITFGGTVFNSGGTTVTGFTAGYKVGSAGWVSGTVSGLSIAPFTSGTFSCTTPATPPAGSTPSQVYVRLTGDATFTNDSLRTAVTGVSSFPTKVPFFEEPTGTWCGFCVRGIVYMDSIYKLHPGGVSVVSVHNADPMQADNASSTHYDTYVGTKIGGYPSLIADRLFVSDPSNVIPYYNALVNYFGFANISMTSTLSGSNMNVTTKVTPTLNLSGDYRVELIVTEDRVHGTATGWDQHNYYSTAYSGGAYGVLKNTEFDFNALPYDIPATTMVYDYVARYTVPDLSTSPNGVAGSLPSTMVSGTTYSWTFSAVPIAANWMSNKMRGVVILIDNNAGSLTYGMALNSVNTRWYVGVSDVKAGIQGLRVFPNPASENARVIFDLDNSADVSVNVYDVVGRLVSSSTEQMNAGEHETNINVANFAAGVYNVVIATANGSVTERLTVTK